MSCRMKRATRLVEGKVHRWAGAVSGQPGGFRVRNPRAAHVPEPVEHPGLVVAGDYLFDSTLNGVLRSASIATELLLDALQPVAHAFRPASLAARTGLKACATYGST